MARVHHVKKAMKDIPSIGVKKGEPYYWCKLKIGTPKRLFKERPRRSQTTLSDFYSQLWDIEDDMSDFAADDTLPDNVSDVANRLRELGEECQDKLSNMPDSLQQGPSGEMLQERASACEAAADELEGIDFEDYSEEEHGTKDEYWEAKLEEVQAVSVEAPQHPLPCPLRQQVVHLSTMRGLPRPSREETAHD